jgi:hypothetical protein
MVPNLLFSTPASVPAGAGLLKPFVILGNSHHQVHRRLKRGFGTFESMESQCFFRTGDFFIKAWKLFFVIRPKLEKIR